MTKPKVRGYLWKQEIINAMRSNGLARRGVKRILNESLPPTTLNIVVAHIAAALADNLESLQNLAKIINDNYPDDIEVSGKESES